LRSAIAGSGSSPPALHVSVLAVATFVLLSFDLGALLFESNDEARFPLMARDVLANGHWLLPEIAGVPMLNKPPLHAWLIALASLPAGAVTPRTAALASALGGLGVVLATTWIGGRLFGAREGLIAGFVAATTVGVFSLSRSPLPDMSLTLAITLAMGAFGLAELEHRRHALIAFYGFTGLAFLTKGPVGLIPLAAALTFLVLARGPKGIGRLRSLPGLALLIALTVPWPLLALFGARHQFLEDVLVKDMHSNYFGLGGWQWRRLTEPIRQAVTVLLPWSVLAPLALWSAARESDRETARRSGLVLSWIAAAFLLTAVSERQRLRYYLPLCPPIALLVAAWYSRLQLPRRASIVAPLCAGLIVVGLVLNERYEVARRNRLADLGALVHALKVAPGPVFAVDSPDLVFGYYLNRPVIPLTYYTQFERMPGHASLIVSERVANSAAPSAPRVATARVNGRPFVLLEK
jgi:4-amino-4-deoxy-L-arabinose transferase-like glycosyltransferase